MYLRRDIQIDLKQATLNEEQIVERYSKPAAVLVMLFLHVKSGENSMTKTKKLHCHAFKKIASLLCET